MTMSFSNVSWRVEKSSTSRPVKVQTLSCCSPRSSRQVSPPIHVRCVETGARVKRRRTHARWYTLDQKERRLRSCANTPSCRARLFQKRSLSSITFHLLPRYHHHHHHHHQCFWRQTDSVLSLPITGYSSFQTSPNFLDISASRTVSSSTPARFQSSALVKPR